MISRLTFFVLIGIGIGIASASTARAAIAPALPPQSGASEQSSEVVATPPVPAVVDVVPGSNAATPAAPTTVAITAQQQTLIIGVDSGTTLRVVLSGPDAAVAVAGRLMATVGTLGPLMAGPTPGTFVTEYRVPADRRPQSALVAIEMVFPGGRRAHGTTQLMLPAAADFPLRSSPHANVWLEVAGTEFGPRRADAEGNVHIPIVVPPGLAVGRARAVNKFGVTKETEVDLQPLDYQRVLLYAPPEGEVGSTVEVEVWAVDLNGEPSLPEDVDLSASAGRVRRLGGVPGMALFGFTLPQNVESRGGAGAVALVASMDDGTSVRPDAMVVHPGPPASIAITSESPRLVVGGGGVARLNLEANDRFGNRAPTHQGLTVTSEGRALPVSVGPAGAQIEVAAPPAWPGRDHLIVQATLGSAQGSFQVPIGGGAPARVALTSSTARVDANGHNAVDLQLEVFDARGIPTSAPAVRWQTGDDGVLESLPAPRFGAYAARFVPRRALRDRRAVLVAGVDPDLSASIRLNVEAGATRSLAVRVGVASNLGSGLGQVAFLEATMPLPRLGRFGRLLSAGVVVGYVHGELTTAPASWFPAVHVDVNQAPVMALARIRVPGDLPVELSFSGAAGVSFATTQLAPTTESPFGLTRGTARAFVIGAGADASVLLRPGELVLGARYLHAELGRNSNGDQIDGNSIGVVCDIGFRIGF